MDHYADDLAALTAHLDTKDAVHVGYPCNRLLRKHGVRFTVFVGASFDFARQNFFLSQDLGAKELRDRCPTQFANLPRDF